jgi:hypothetical protein
VLRGIEWLAVPRTPYLIQDDAGVPIGVLLSVREKWQPRDTLVLEGRRLSGAFGG